MVLNRIHRSFTNNKGTAEPFILAIILFVMVTFAMLFQYFYTTTILNTIHESCCSIAEDALIANAETSYQAKRDGYTGVWHLESGEVSNNTVHIDPRASFAEQLNLVREDDDLIKKDGDEETYRLRDIQLSIQNPDFQKNNTLLIATISLIVDVELKFPLIDSYPISIPVEVSATWNPKF